MDRLLKDPLFQNRQLQARLKFAAGHMDKDNACWRNVLRPYETKTELFSHNDRRYRETLYQHLSTVIIASGTRALHKVARMMKNLHL